MIENSGSGPDSESFLQISDLEPVSAEDSCLNHPLASEIQKLPWFCFSQLKDGDKVRIITKHTHYILEIIDAKNLIISVGTIFGLAGTFKGIAVFLGTAWKETEETISLRAKQLAIGFSAVLFTNQGILRLPVTQIVWLNGRQVLPDLKNIPNREP